MGHFEYTNLDQYTDVVRSAQFIYQAGPGAMLNFPNQVLMTAAPREWASKVTPIHDSRLEKRLGVHYFGLPIKTGDELKDLDKKMRYVRFPEWYYCPKCRKFQPMEKWMLEHQKVRKDEWAKKDMNMVRRPACPHCLSHPTLIPARLVTVCKHGHIDDFPWVEWVHWHSNPKRQVCDNPELIFNRPQGGQGMKSLKVSCKCGASAPLAGATFQDAMEQLERLSKGRLDCHCKGRHPWKGIERESCNEYPKAQVRGASSNYFPVTISSLVIPPYSSELVGRIQDSNEYEEEMKIIKKMEKRNGAPYTDSDYESEIPQCAAPIARELGCEVKDVEDALRIIWLKGNDVDDDDDYYKYRCEEYQALNGSKKGGKSQSGDFVLEQHRGDEYEGVDFIDSISLVHKVKEVRVLLGFSRVEPVSSSKDEGFVDIKDENDDWYPGIEVRGEGIFIQFNSNRIDEWIANSPALAQRVERLNENYARSYYSSVRERYITAKFLFLHSLAHALLRQLSFECGYGIASLRERIYCDKGMDDEDKMAGIFIYTANGDSEGTLGGLVRQGYPDIFPKIFHEAVEAVQLCSNDPVCSMSEGQGTNGLNLAACHSCMLLPETSCEEFNSFLDRGVLIGTLEEPGIGFFSNREDLKSPMSIAKIKMAPKKKSKKTEPKENRGKYTIEIISAGSEEDYENPKEMLENLESCDLTERETKRVKELKGRVKKAALCYSSSQMKINETNEILLPVLYFSGKKIMLFTNKYMEHYESARQVNGFESYCLDDEQLDIDKLVDIISQ